MKHTKSSTVAGPEADGVNGINDLHQVAVEMSSTVAGPEADRFNGINDLHEVAVEMSSQPIPTLRNPILDAKELVNIGQRFSTRSDFLKNNSSAYMAARRLGILDIVCEHMKNSV